MEEVRRSSDHELEGFVVEREGSGAEGGWLALTVFGGVLGSAAARAEAIAIVHARGLSSMAERWHWWSRSTQEWQVVVPQEVSPGRVRVAIGYYSLPGVETAMITAADLAAGDRLTLEEPPEAGSAIRG